MTAAVVVVTVDLNNLHNQLQHFYIVLKDYYILVLNFLNPLLLNYYQVDSLYIEFRKHIILISYKSKK